MKKYKMCLVIGGLLSLIIALFQAVIGLSPSLSLYFGAPESLVGNVFALFSVSIMISFVVAVFGAYALSGSGYIRILPWMKQVLVAISIIYILRGFLLVPEFFVVIGYIDSPIPVAPRFVLFSLGSLLIGLIYLYGTVSGWQMLPSKQQR